MSSLAPFAQIAELFERSLTIRHVYGEAVHHGETTVIPVARVAYGFGGGGGQGPGRGRKGGSEKSADPTVWSDAEGAGGGGGAWLTPVGAFEVGPQGTRFVSIRPLTPWIAAGSLGVAIGWMLGRRRRRSAGD